jgi:hypothetical protein
VATETLDKLAVESCKKAGWVNVEVGYDICDCDLWCIKGSTAIKDDFGYGILTCSIVTLEGSFIDIDVACMVLARVFR